ncbi:MAG: RNA methyltransferase [Burkholderiales bacterium]
MPRVTARENPRLVEAARLIASSRDRRKRGKCVLEGDHLVGVYLDRVGMPETLLVVEERMHDPRIASLIARVPARDVLSMRAALFAETVVAPADVAVAAVIPTPEHAIPVPARRHLLLEDIQDPGNVGTMLRTAAAAGVDQVLLSRHCAFAWSPKVLRAGQGAHFAITVVEDVDLPAWCAGFAAAGGQVIATAPRYATPLYEAAVREPWAVAIGNEGAGLSPALLERAGLRVAIPMHEGTESLNAGAAAAVVLFELVRRRQRDQLGR